MKRSAILFASLILVAGAYGCKTTSSAESGSTKARLPPRSEKAAKPAPANIPAGSPLAKVKMGMQRAQVYDLIGQPTSTRVFPSGKGFIPFYYGPDTVRTGAFYKGLGRVVFSGADRSSRSSTIPPKTGTDSRAAGRGCADRHPRPVPPSFLLCQGDPGRYARSQRPAHHEQRRAGPLRVVRVRRGQERPFREGIDLVGGADKFARKDEKILLKANLLVGDAPEKCVNTHPSVLRAVAEIFKTTGARISYGDSPAIGTARAASRKIGMDVAANEAGIELKEFQPGREVHFPEGLQNKRFTIANAVLESDGVISLPKLKAHGMQKFTGCVKNQFGCIPGLLKGEFHVRIPDAYAVCADAGRPGPPGPSPALHHGRDRRHGRQRPPRRHPEKDERAAFFGGPHRGRCDRLPPDRSRSAARADHRVRPRGRSRHPRAGKHRVARRRLRFIPVSRFCHRPHRRSNPTRKRAPCDSSAIAWFPSRSSPGKNASGAGCASRCARRNPKPSIGGTATRRSRPFTIIEPASAATAVRSCARKRPSS